MPTKIEQIQEILGVKVDNDWGPISMGALNAEIRKSKEVTDAPPLPPPTGAVHPFIAAAAPWMGKPETSRNRFDGDKKLWADTNYSDGWENREPYCAAFQCHIVAQAQRDGAKVAHLPKSASVSEFRNWARELKYTVTEPQPGDQFTLLPSGTSHMGLVERVDGDIIYTMEGNTDAGGSREGDGFWRKTRRKSKCDFLRIPVS